MNKERFISIASAKRAELESKSAELKRLIDGVASGSGFVFTLRASGYHLIGYTEAERPSWFDDDNSAEYVGEAVRWFRATAVSGVRAVLDV